MAASVREVRGLSQMLKNMEKLPRELTSKNGGIVRSALFVAVKRVRNRARLLAPKPGANPYSEGVTEKNIIAVRDRDPRASGASERYIITVRKKLWGRKAKQKAVRKTSGKIDYRRSGDAFYWIFVELGTRLMKAMPFLRPAFEQEKSAAVDDFKGAVVKGIRRVVRKMKKG